VCCALNHPNNDNSPPCHTHTHNNNNNNNNNNKKQQTVDAGISSQYLDTWNNLNGANTQYWPAAAALMLADRVGGDDNGNANYTSRALLRFGGLHNFVPPTATVLAAKLTLTFVNWRGGAAKAQACALALAWDGTAPSGAAPAFSGLGWRYRLYSAATGRSLPWSRPGAWSNCAPAAGGMAPRTFSVPAGNAATGLTKVTLTLPPAYVKRWVASGGARNFGLLLRLGENVSGSVDLSASQSGDEGRRPRLEVRYK
jgi:hypothetical protein